jgi:squalene synthase HpnC
MDTAVSDARSEDPARGAKTGAAVETPSGKGSGDENFPVGSILLPAHLRPTVARFYAFARAGDDIADNPDLAPDDKLARLAAFDTALAEGVGDGGGLEKAQALRAALAERGVTDRHGRDLLKAFSQDATKTRYANWQELLGYCELSANPVGRFLLDLHGERASDYPPSDALCTALQILNHLQDCGDDAREMDRIYVPQDWMAEEGAADADLLAGAASPSLRRVMDRMLVGIDDLLIEARRLPAALKSRRLAMESAIIVRLATRLCTKLKRADPIATRIALSKVDFAAATAGGAIEGLFGRKARR